MNDSIKKPMDILKHLLPSKILADDLELIEDKLNKLIEALEFYACEDYHKTLLNDPDHRGMYSRMEVDKGKIARETLNEIRNRTIDLRREKAKESQDKEVEKME